MVTYRWRQGKGVSRRRLGGKPTSNLACQTDPCLIGVTVFANMRAHSDGISTSGIALATSMARQTDFQWRIQHTNCTAKGTTHT